MSMKETIKIFVILGLFISVISVTSVHAQVRAGAAFLKMLPGARVQSMAASHTAEIDDPHAIYANPGATGYLREWQWTAGYSKWIADIYNASFVYGRKIAMPWSRQSKFALGLLYQGMPEFDSSDHTVASVQASDVLVTLSMGQPIDFDGVRLSLGTNAKYFQSTLADYSADAFAFDFGVSIRSNRFSLLNSLLPNGVVSLGAAITHIGPDLSFENTATPLPRTWRVGGAFYAGRHGGFELRVIADYHSVLDEEPVMGLGAEISLGRILSVNGGYNLGADLMDKISFGASIRLDDITTPSTMLIPGRNNALRADIATLDEGEFFARTYRGTVSHYPIGPESFRFLSPAMNDTIYSNSVILEWEKSQDPDLFDEVKYRLLFDRDSTKLAAILDQYNRNTDSFYRSFTETDLLVNIETGLSAFAAEKLAGGHYFWSVAAIDSDQHIRFASLKGRKIAHFYIPLPDIEIRDVEFDYSPWITENDFHGNLKITLANSGDLPAENFKLVIRDSVDLFYEPIRAETEISALSSKLLLEKTIDFLNVNQDTTLDIEWHTNLLGRHVIVAHADQGNSVEEIYEDNNIGQETFHTIPKGVFSTDDSVNVVKIAKVLIDMPIITDITFDDHSHKVRREYIKKDVIEPPLATLAERLVNNRNLKVQLKGFADPNSGEENIELANKRSEAIQDSLIKLGVNPAQIEIESGEVMAYRPEPSNPTDARWVFQERRHLEISASERGQAILFVPVRQEDRERIIKGVPFQSAIKSAVSFEDAEIITISDDRRDSLNITYIEGMQKLDRNVLWQPLQEEINFWSNTGVDYFIEISDSLGRTFRTRLKETYLTSEEAIREYRLALPLKFAETDPVYGFYWSRLLNQVKPLFSDNSLRVAFRGHACATGPREVNKRLSQRRARRFHRDFLQYLQENYPNYYEMIKDRIDEPKGFGEDEPLSITRLDGERILIGDNEKPTGRKLNRRIEFVFYSTEADFLQE